MVDLKNPDPLKYIKCDNGKCGKYSFEQDLKKNDYKCPYCGNSISMPERPVKSDISLEETIALPHVAKRKNEPHEEIKDELAKFLLSLIQAFLRTGYYTSDHPQSKKAKQGLYDNFQRLLNREYELTFLAYDAPGGKNILIEGILPEPQELKSIMLQGMAEAYTPRFVKFLERKDLISLTLKAAMGWTEFDNFIDVMSEPTFAETLERSDKERFVQILEERSIFNISYIFDEELVARNRDIPWRSQVALSRLRKDLKMIPLFKDMDEKGLKRVKRQIIQDVVRPIRTADIIYPILVNSDLAETEQFKESEIDKEMINSLSDSLLFQISRTLLKATLSQESPDSNHKKLLRLAKEMAYNLTAREINGREEIIEGYYENQLIPIEELPEAAQRKIKMRQDIDNFVQHCDVYLKKFEEIQDAQKYVRVARSLRNIIPELIRKDCYEEILKIITQLDRHSNDKRDLSKHAKQILDEIVNGNILGSLKAKFISGQKEICLAVAPILVKLGKPSVPHILPLLEESDDQIIKKTVYEILVRIDPSNINLVLHELSGGGFGTTSTVRIIRALGEAEGDTLNQTLAAALQSFLDNENPRLREEALWSYYRLMGAKGEKLYLDRLSDEDIGVQKKAIQCLGRMKSETALNRFLEILKELENAPSDKMQQIDSTLFRTLASYGNLELPDGGTIEDLLLQTLERQVSLGRLKIFKKNKSVLSDAAIAAICESLGKIGTINSRSILQKLEKQDNVIWQKKAREALRTIVERVNLSQH